MPMVAANGSKFKAVNNRNRNFTQANLQRRMAKIEVSISRYLTDLDTADRHPKLGMRAKPANRLPTPQSTLLAWVGRMGVDVANVGR